jgi:hypothetical protein
MIFNKVVNSRSVVYKVNFPPFSFVRWGIFARRTVPYKTFHFIENYFCPSQTSRSRMLQSIVGTIFLDLVSHTIKEDAKLIEYCLQGTVYRVQFTEYRLQITSLFRSLFIFASEKYGPTQFNVEEKKC